MTAEKSAILLRLSQLEKEFSDEVASLKFYEDGRGASQNVHSLTPNGKGQLAAWQRAKESLSKVIVQIFESTNA